MARRPRRKSEREPTVSIVSEYPPGERPDPDRSQSSIHQLPLRVREVGRAWRDGDEGALRAELRALAAEAALLSQMEPLIRTPVRQRQEITPFTSPRKGPRYS